MGGARGQQGRFCAPCAREEAGGRRGRSAHAHSRGRCPLGWRACGRRGRARSRRGRRLVLRSRARGGRRCLSSRGSDDLPRALARGGRVCVACAPVAACAAGAGAAATVGSAAAGPLRSMGRRIDNSSTRRISDRATNQQNATAVVAAAQNAVTVEEGAEAGSPPGAKRSLASPQCTEMRWAQSRVGASDSIHRPRGPCSTSRGYPAHTNWPVGHTEEPGRAYTRAPR